MVLEHTKTTKSADAPVPSPPVPSPPVPQVVITLLEFAELFGRVALLFHQGLQAIVVQAAEAEQKHRRAKLLVACRGRRFWRASDAAGLRSLGAKATAVRRAIAAGGTGRPRVCRYVSLGTLLGQRLQTMSCLLNGEATEAQRRAAFPHWPWMRFHVEAMYRGEHRLAQIAETKSPNEAAERAVASTLRRSPGWVHNVCSRVRTLEGDDARSFPEMTVAQFEHWMRTGEHPRQWHLAD